MVDADRGSKAEAFTAQEAAALLNAHVETVRRLARRGRIPAFKLGKDWRFPKDALLQWGRTSSVATEAGRGQDKQAGGQPERAGEPPAVEAADRDGAFPIVGIGASAGGLEAIEQFLRQVPENSGLAFIVVQHLDPTHKGMMVEILQRKLALKIVQITDRMAIEPNFVYIIPPTETCP